MTCLPDIHFKRPLRSLVEVALFSCLCILYVGQVLKAEDVKLDLQSRIQTIYNNHHTSVVRVKATREVLLDNNKTRRRIMGKGSKRRPEDNKKYKDNWERIFKKPKKKGKA